MYGRRSLQFIRKPLRVAHRLTRYCQLFGPVTGAGLFGRELAGNKSMIASSSTIASGVDLAVRLGTTDISVLAKVFLETEYDVQLKRTPKTIIDAGAYTGYSTVFLAGRFPDATIVALEPEPANFRLLQSHVAELPNVIAVHAALWSGKRAARGR